LERFLGNVDGTKSPPAWGRTGEDPSHVSPSSEKILDTFFGLKSTSESPAPAGAPLSGGGQEEGLEESSLDTVAIPGDPRGNVADSDWLSGMAAGALLGLAIQERRSVKQKHRKQKLSISDCRLQK
jgi:hypothetical protein